MHIFNSLFNHFDRNNTHSLITGRTPTIVTFQTHWGMLHGCKIIERNKLCFWYLALTMYWASVFLRCTVFILLLKRPIYSTHHVTSMLFSKFYKFALGALMSWFLYAIYKCLKRSSDLISAEIWHSPLGPDKRTEKIILFILLWSAWWSLISHFLSAHVRNHGEMCPV